MQGTARITATTPDTLGRDRQAALDAMLREAFPDIAGAYPHPQPPAFLVLAEDSGRIAGHLAGYRRDALAHGTPLAIGMVGAVAVAPQYRRQGIATAMLDRAHDQFRALALPYAMLFAYDHRHYRPAGYRPMPNTIRFLEDGESREFVYRGGMIAELTDEPWNDTALIDLQGPVV
jgi:GNAT superfamily N-acetyltransferase